MRSEGLQVTGKKGSRGGGMQGLSYIQAVNCIAVRHRAPLVITQMDSPDDTARALPVQNQSFCPGAGGGIPLCVCYEPEFLSRSL